MTMDNPFTYSAYSAYLKEHRFMGSKDSASGEVFFPPRPINPASFSTDMEWVEFSGEGILKAFTIVYIGTVAMCDAGYNRKNPYCVGIVETKEGPMVSALILDVNPCEPEMIKIGMPLTVAFVDQGEGDCAHTLLAFQPA
jgi:uncharacterized protein